MEESNKSDLQPKKKVHQSLDEDLIEMQDTFRIPERSPWHKPFETIKWFSFLILAAVVAIIFIYQLLT